MENLKKRFESEAFRDDFKFYTIFIATATILAFAIIYSGCLTDLLHSVSGETTVWK